MDGFVGPAEDVRRPGARPPVAARLLGVEAGRGLAALLIVLLHASDMLGGAKDYGVPVFGGLMLFGHAGVDFFFVLSGFIIGHVHADDLGRPAAWGPFWRKRLLRIYPPYWVAFLILGCILVVSPTADRVERQVWHVVASALLLPDGQKEPVLGVAWSLQHEMLFYGLFSLAVLNRKLGMAVFAAWAALLAFNVAWQVAAGAPFFSGVLTRFVFRGFNIEFFFGLACAWLVRRHPARQARAMMLVGTVLFLGNGMLESFGPRMPVGWPPRLLAYALGSALALYGCACLDRQRAWRMPKPLLVLGGASYSIYLVHVIAMLLVQQVLRAARPILDFPLNFAYFVMVASGVTAGIVFSAAVERPLLRAGRRALVSERG